MKYKCLFLLGLGLTIVTSIYAMQPMQLLRKVHSEIAEQEETPKLKKMFERAYNAYTKGDFNYNARRYFRIEVAMYLKSGADPNGFITADMIQMPFLFAAVRMGDLELTKLLLQAGANPNLPHSGGNNSLIEGLGRMRDYPIIDFYEKIVLLLLEYGADPNFIPNWDASALSIAVSSDSPRVVRKLLDKGASANFSSLDIIGGKQIATYKLRNTDIAQILLNAGFNENIKDEAGNNALIRAVIGEFPVKIIKVLLDNGWNVNIRNNVGNTPLLYAVFHGKEEIAKLLIEAGADVNMRGSQGYTALINAIWARNIIESLADITVRKKMLELLLASGADPNIADNNGQTPLMHALNSDANTANVEILLAAGADPNIVNRESKTALMLPVEENDLAKIHLLLENGANPNLPRPDYNAKTVAQQMGNQAIIDFLNREVTIKKAGLRKIE